MAEILKVQMEDEHGNIFYLHTLSDIVFCSDGSSVEEKLNKKLDSDNIIALNGVTITPSEWVEKNYYIRNSNIKGKSACDIYFANDSIIPATKAKLTATIVDGTLMLHAEKVPIVDIVIEVIKVVNIPWQ